MSTSRPTIAPNYTGPRLFGAPVGDFSLLQTLLMIVASGVASFFAATFVGIVVLLVWSQVVHHMLDFSIAYRWVGLPVGITVFCVAAVYLTVLLFGRLRRQSATR